MNAGIGRNTLCFPGTETSYFNTRVSMTCSSNSVSTDHIGYSIILCEKAYIVLVVLPGDGTCSCLPVV